MAQPRQSFGFRLAPVTAPADEIAGGRAMFRKLVAALALVSASGCRMCSDSCDYLPPVADASLTGTNGRAGSAFNGLVYPTTPPTPQAPTSASPPAPGMEPPTVP